METPYRNAMLRALSPGSLERLQLTSVNLEVGHQLLPAVGSDEAVYFLEEGLASTTLQFGDGRQVEIGIVGNNSMVGSNAIVDLPILGSSTFIQVRGRGFMAPLRAAKLEFAHTVFFRTMVRNSARAQLSEAAQLAACNALHNDRQRLARWLLLCVDRTQSVVFDISQEFLSRMLGVSRPQISVAASGLKASGYLEYSRGTVHVRDRVGLESAACECYERAREIDRQLLLKPDR